MTVFLGYVAKKKDIPDMFFWTVVNYDARGGFLFDLVHPGKAYGSCISGKPRLKLPTDCSCPCLHSLAAKLSYRSFYKPASSTSLCLASSRKKEIGHTLMFCESDGKLY